MHMKDKKIHNVWTLGSWIILNQAYISCTSWFTLEPVAEEIIEIETQVWYLNDYRVIFV
jgi:hypothetical protein